MKQRAICLQHVPFEGPGVFKSALEERGFDFVSRLVPRSGPPKDVPDALVIMGGPMSVNDTDAWLEAEKEYIRTCVKAGIPVLGVCLGSQLLADAHGGTVAPSATPEIGLHPIQLTKAAKDDPCFGELPKTFDVFQWHGESITKAPPKSVVLASSATETVQAFRIKDNAYGLLFHCEIDAQTVADLCQACSSDLRGAKTTANKVERAYGKARPDLHTYAHAIIDGFVSQLIR